MESKDISHETVSLREEINFSKVPFCDWETGRGNESASIFSLRLFYFKFQELQSHEKKINLWVL